MDLANLQISSGTSSSARARGGYKETCALCPRPGLRCGNCWQVNYCSKEHQVEHRPIHKAQCKPYKICTNSILGRHLVATRPIQAMTPILTSKPTVLGPMRMEGTLCLGCGKKMSYVGEFLQCSLCGFPMCSKDCHTNPWHLSECAAVHARGLKQSKGSVMLWEGSWDDGVAIAIFTLRCLLLEEKERLKVLQLQSHVEDFRANEMLRWWFSESATFIQSRLGLSEFSTGDIWNMSAIAITNSIPITHSISTPYLVNCQMAALHASDLSMVENSCLPNAMPVHKVEGCTKKATLIATEVIQPGEHISISYLCPRLGKGNISRQVGARRFWNFTCMCRRCMDPTELGLYVNSICCSKCQQLGKMTLIPVANPELETASWKCPGCSSIIPSDVVVNVHTTLVSHHSELPDNVNVHKTFLEVNLWPRGLLHPMHELILGSKLKIINSTTFGDFPEYKEMLKDLERFYRKSSPAMYLADMYRMSILLAEVYRLKKESSSLKHQGDRQKMKEKLLSLEAEIQKPLSCYMSESNQLNHKTATDKIKRHISEIKLK